MLAPTKMGVLYVGSRLVPENFPRNSVTCALWKLSPTPPEAQRAKASVISDSGFPPPSSGNCQLSTVWGPPQHSSESTSLPLALEQQANFGEGWEAGWQGPSPGCQASGLAAVSTVRSCLQMFFKA